MIEVTVEKMVYGGKGLARHEGLALFVPGVLPGERVRVEARRKRKGYMEAELLEIVTPSPDRIDPPCRGAEESTGAHWPFIAYPAQLRLKEEVLLETLWKIGKIAPSRCLPILPSPDRDHYRLRVRLSVRYGAAAPRIGFFREGTHDLVEVRNGFLLHPLINRTLEAIRGIAVRLPPLEEIHINASPDGEVLVLLMTKADDPPGQDRVYESLQEKVPDVVGVVSYAGRRKRGTSGRNFIRLGIEGLNYRVTEGNFFQVNWGQNRNLIRVLVDMAGPAAEKTVLDLYCGIGNFSLPLARAAGRVIGIESGDSAVDDARRTALESGISNVEFVSDDVRGGLNDLLEEKARIDLVVLDPPRAGVTLTVIKRIMALAPEKVLYVSCNPATLARDLAIFQGGGYLVDRLLPIDMFPQTYHIEAIAELIPRKDA